jgi:hypothetical protein
MIPLSMGWVGRRGTRRSVEGAVREVDEQFVRSSHDVVLGRNDGSYCVSPIWATGLIRHLAKMWCSRPAKVRGLHHQRSQLQVTPFAPGMGRRLLQITASYDWVTIFERVMPRLFNTTHFV